MSNRSKLLPFVVVLVIGLAVGFTFAALVLGTGNDAKKQVDGAETDHAAMTQQMTDMTTALKDKKGDAFDREFLSQMIAHHEGAVEMARLALQSAGHSEIKDLAEKIISSQNEEIVDMKEWQQAWYRQ